MPYTITPQCISCDRCRTSCPTQAIQTTDGHYWIDVNRCNNCAHSYGVAQCWATCPTNLGCVATVAQPLGTGPTLTSTDYWETWFDTYERTLARLKIQPPASYWGRWFDTYAHALARLLHHNTVEA